MNTTKLSRRSLVKGLTLTFGAATLGAITSPLARGTAASQPQSTLASTPHALPALPYDFNALETAIDATTMMIHHDKHHAAYVTNLNNALKDYPNLQQLSAEELVMNLSKVPKSIQTAVRNNAGGHVNHSWFWQMMKPGGSQPSGALANAINAAFGSFDAFKAAFVSAGTGRFGSGWVWLEKDKKGKLGVLSTPYQDNPLMAEYGRATPLLGNDVWEHAYYLRYQNRRKDYLDAWWQVVNWDFVAQRFGA
jgi:Fe-Mn family superoxide dismutase